MDTKDILTKIDHKTGMTVPEGYFADFASRMAAQLPEQEWEKPQPKVVPRSMWQRVRPYVYMAAMFAGIWCMLKMFDFIRPTNGLAIDSNPVLVSALSNDNYFDDYYAREVDETDLMDDLFSDGFDPAMLDDEAK